MIELNSLIALAMLMALRVGKRREEGKKERFRSLPHFDTTGTTLQTLQGGMGKRQRMI